MEAVREKKPRPKERTRPAAPEGEVPAPPIPARQPVALRLPPVPTHTPKPVERSVSPEPEEITLSDEESTSIREPSRSPRTPRTTPSVEASVPAVNGVTVAATETPPIPARNLIFPRTAPLPPVEASNITPVREAPPLPPKEKIVESVPQDKAAEAAAVSATPVPRYPRILPLSTDVDTAYNIRAPPSYAEISASTSTRVLEHNYPLPASPSTRQRQPVVAEAPPMYPNLSTMVMERNEHGLLTEPHLLLYYHNPQYERAEDYVDRFVANEEIPRGVLFDLLRRLRAVCDSMAISEVNEKANTEALKKCLRDCWIVQQQLVQTQGRCSENREAQGSIKVQTAQLNDERTREMKRLLAANRTTLLDERLCQEAHFRSIALQIQWEIISINSQFMRENALTNQSPPCLLESAVNNNARLILLSALSDLCYHLRFPTLPVRFTETLTSWIKELICVLNMWCRCEDGQFVLNHLLRLPSPMEWAAPLVQTFIQAASQPKLKLDYCVTILSHLMNPIKGRESFLKMIGQSEKDESTWAVLGDDEEVEEFSFVTMNEIDLCSFLDQLPIPEIYSVAYLHFFSSTTESHKSGQFISLVAFQLLLMKILDDGLTTYSRPGYKQFCKHIGMNLRQSVRELCSHWRVTRNVVAPGEEQQLQLEVDRLVLLAVQYLTNRDSSGLWQFLVDLPYDCVSEECRTRCEYMLRSKQMLSVKEVYDTPICEIQARIKAGGLREKAEALGEMDAVFLVNSLAAISAASHSEPSTFMKELVEVCFCDESCRESLYKVGGEAIGQILARRPNSLDTLLTILDRNTDHMGQYAVDVLASSSLSGCKISQPVLSLLGKWLMNKTPDDASNRMARRVMSGLHWGKSPNGEELWLDDRIHQGCAEIIVKAHSVHCSSSNGMIAKSIQKITRIANKMPDHEQKFNQFCWDLLIKLKLKPPTAPMEKPSSNLAAYFIYLIRTCLESAAIFVEKGVPLLSDLVGAGCSTACVVIIGRLMRKHYTDVGTLGSNKSFVDVFERVLHIDQCSYAVQLLYGPNSTATPIIRLICSSISFYTTKVGNVGEYLRAWVDLLCVRRMSLWNDDPATLQVLDTIVRIAFLKDPKSLLGIPEVMFTLYQQMLISFKEASRGLLSFLSSDPPPPALLSSTNYTIAPWATYLLLLVECKSYPTFYQFLYEALAKKNKTTLEQAVKKAADKSSMALTLTRLSVFRWAEFVTLCKDSVVLPLAVQRLATEAYRLRTVNNVKYNFARRFIDAVQAEPIMSACKKAMQEIEDQKGLVRAASGWLFTTQEVKEKGFNFSCFDLDYLLQLILADDTNIWLDFVNLQRIQTEQMGDDRLYVASCHLNNREPTRQALDLASPRLTVSRAQPFPSLPSHPGLPPAPVVDNQLLFQQQRLIQMAAPCIKTVNTVAAEFVTGGDKVGAEDGKYNELLTRLYTSSVKNMEIQLRCGARCAQPSNVVVPVTVWDFSFPVDAQMTQNREKRGSMLAELHVSVLDKAAVHTAMLEHMSRQVARLSALCSPAHRAQAQVSGRALYYMVTSALSGDEVLFPAATAAYEQVLRILGYEFVRFRPEEQLIVMKLVLDGFVLSEPLVEVFTPECLNSTALCDAYAQLSEAVRNPECSIRALQLLGRLGMDRAAANLPPQQFAALLPQAFRNLASQPDPNAPLHVLCFQHVVAFVFHAFPANFLAGFDLTMTGCSKGVTPVTLLNIFVTKLGAENFESPNGEYRLDSVKSTECVRVIARHLSDSRKSLPSFYSTWCRYIDPLTRLAQLCLFTPLKATFNPQAPVSVLQKELLEWFDQCQSVFSPLIAPASPALPPFSPSHENEAGLTLERFVQLLNALPHNTAIPSKLQNVQSLVWQYYFEKLSILTHGPAHYFATLEKYLVRLHWPSMWPTLRGVTAMDECLSGRSKEAAPFIAQMVVRLPWKDVLQDSITNDMRPEYIATIASVLARIVSRVEVYSKVRASLLELLKSLSQRTDWGTVTPERTQTLADTIIGVMPTTCLSSPEDVCAIFMIIWRKICCFSPREAFSMTSLEKQTIWIRTECRLILQGGPATALSAYNSTISDVGAVAVQHSNLRAFCVPVSELTALWSSISEVKFGESLVTCWMDYMSANVESPLVLVSLSTVIASLHQDQLSTALKVIEHTITVYFKRVTCTWAEVMMWIQFPTGSQQIIEDYLLGIPSADKKIVPQMKTLRTYLDYGNHGDGLFLRLHSYIIQIKPKHVICEASLLLLLCRLLQWLTSKSRTQPAVLPAGSDLMQPLIAWLGKAARDDSSFFTNMISNKKTAYTPKLRAVLQIAELYVTQQSLGEGRRPRCEEGEPVMNSRMQALSEAAAVKANQAHAAAFNLATAYFSNVSIHNLGSASQLLMRCGQVLLKDAQFLKDE